jgi:NifU-like protein involved in Fe-S cluster formation
VKFTMGCSYAVASSSSILRRVKKQLKHFSKESYELPKADVARQ